MSANNYLEIHRDGKEYIVSDLCVETDAGSELHHSKSLKAAIEWATEYEQNNTVEYGLRFGSI